jgi:hypothetical protein
MEAQMTAEELRQAAREYLAQAFKADVGKPFPPHVVEAATEILTRPEPQPAS